MKSIQVLEKNKYSDWMRTYQEKFSYQVFEQPTIILR